MIDFNENIPTGYPKLPENYWGVHFSDVSLQASEINIFDKNLTASLSDINISIFKNKKEA